MDVNDEDQTQKKLDMEFRRILRVIKPYIPCIMNNDHLFSYRMWLEKLSEADGSEKIERNLYLIELCRQIQDGILEKPFMQLPSPGPLPPFQTDSECIQQGNSPTKQALQNVPTKELNEKNLNDKCKLLQHAMQNIKFKPPPFSVKYNEQHKKRNKLTVLKQVETNSNNQKCCWWKSPYPFSEDSPPQGLSKSYLPDNSFNLLQSKKEEKYKMSHTNCTKDQKVQQNKDDFYAQKLNHIMSPNKLDNKEAKLKKDPFENDSSWYDLSEVNSSTVSKAGSGDSDDRSISNSPRHSVSPDKSLKEFDSQFNQLSNSLLQMQSKSSMLNTSTTHCDHDLCLRNTKAETSMHCLADEVESLKIRLKELVDIKATLKKSEIMVTSHWQSKVLMLNKQLHSSQNQIVFLKNEIISIEKKLEDFTMSKQKELSCLKDKLTQLHAKEIHMMKEHHAKQMSNVEAKFNGIMERRESEFDQQLSKLKIVHDNKLAEIAKEYETIIQERNNEIRRLEDMVENKCKKMHEEVLVIRSQMEDNAYSNNDSNLEKIAFLQKCIGRMDKLFKKSEKEYHKQVTKLRREIAIRDKSLQLQLASQKAEIVSTANTMKQEEIDNLVLTLEDRYKKLLDNQQSYFLQDKQHDINLIKELRAIIVKNCGDNYDFYNSPDM